MPADSGADGAQQVGGVGCAEEAGQKVYSASYSGRLELDGNGQWSCPIGIVVGTIELIGDRPLVRHGATYEDLSERWYSTEAAARAALSSKIEHMASGLFRQALWLREAARQEAAP